MLRLFHIVLVLGNRVKILKLPLYSIQFLHQITTKSWSCCPWSCCIVSNFYIKSQRGTVATVHRDSVPKPEVVRRVDEPVRRRHAADRSGRHPATRRADPHGPGPPVARPRARHTQATGDLHRRHASSAGKTRNRSPGPKREERPTTVTLRRPGRILRNLRLFRSRLSLSVYGSVHSLRSDRRSASERREFAYISNEEDAGTFPFARLRQAHPKAVSIKTKCRSRRSERRSKS